MNIKSAANALRSFEPSEYAENETMKAKWRQDAADAVIAHLAQPVTDDDEGTQPGCTGAPVCPAPAHQHGCFADLLGHCNEPEEHPIQPVTGTVEEIPDDLSYEEMYGEVN